MSKTKNAMHDMYNPELWAAMAQARAYACRKAGEEKLAKENERIATLWRSASIKHGGAISR